MKLNKINHIKHSAEHESCEMLSASVTFNTEGHAIVRKQLYPAINYRHILLLETTVRRPPHQRKGKERNEA